MLLYFSLESIYIHILYVEKGYNWLDGLYI